MCIKKKTFVYSKFIVQFGLASLASRRVTRASSLGERYINSLHSTATVFDMRWIVIRHSTYIAVVYFEVICLSELLERIVISAALLSELSTYDILA